MSDRISSAHGQSGADRNGCAQVPRYGLSYRDLEELLAERGSEVDHVTPYRWAQRFTPRAFEHGR